MTANGDLEFEGIISRPNNKSRSNCNLLYVKNEYPQQNENICFHSNNKNLKKKL